MKKWLVVAGQQPTLARIHNPEQAVDSASA
jgi:hypothetical protein